jgi:hypothetical protein
LPTLSGVISRNGEKREPPGSPPQLSQAMPGRDENKRSVMRAAEQQGRVANARLTYFGFLAGSGGRAPLHGSYFSLDSGMRSSAAL